MLADFAARRGITFPLLSDAGSDVIKAYGILNTTVPATNTSQLGIPFPGTFIVDRAGLVTSRFFEPAYQERNTVSSILVRLGQGIEADAIRISAPHLEITTYATDRTVAPGTHFSLVLDAVPGPRIHVYAPGVSGYRPISLTVEPQPGLVVRGAQYPAPEIYHLKPLDERVPVYQKPFRMVQDVMIDPSPEGAKSLAGANTLTIRARLEYQACDDELCFLPQSIPISWTVALRPLDRERVQPR